ncbi:MAG: diphthine synthase [Sulfolobales archaeon]
MSPGGGHLYIVGLGLSPMFITLEAIKVLKSCDHIFYEDYTSLPANGSIEDVEAIVGRRFVRLGRRDLEDLSARPLFEALERGERVCLACWGDPMAATTHIYIATEAVRRGYSYTYIPGVSAITSSLGYAGLMVYRLGRVMSVVRPRSREEASGIYRRIREAIDRGLHVLLLLELSAEENYFMGFDEASRILISIASEEGDPGFRYRLGIGAAGLGSPGQRICYGSLEELSKTRIELKPQILLLLGELYFTEKEYIDSMVKRYGKCWGSL